MLNEIIRNVGYNNIIKTIKDDLNMKNSLYIKIPFERELDLNEDILYINKEIEIPQLEKAEWFKEREVYSQRIMPNKSIVIGGMYSKMVSTCTPYCITFNWDNFINHKNTDKDNLEKSFENIINEFLSKLQLEDNLKYYTKYFKEISAYILGNNFSKFLIKIFLDKPVDEFKVEYLKHIENTLFDKGTQIVIDGKESGRVSLFYTLNTADKPFLAHMMANTDEIHLLNAEESEKILNLKKYMDSVKRENLENNIAKIEYKMELNMSTKKWYLDKYNVNPTQIRDDIVNFNISNVLEDKYFKEISINKYTELSQYILRLLDFNVKIYYSDNDNTASKFKVFSSLYFNYIEKIDNTNIEVFKNVYPNIIKNIYTLYKNEDSIGKMRNILNFDISFRDYLYQTNIKEEFTKMMENIKNKIIVKGKYTIENEAEFFILCGQMAKFLKLQTQTDEKTNGLYSEYLMATNTKRLMTILARDKNRLDYASNIYGRSNKIMYSILEYYSVNKDNLKKIDVIEFNKGLYFGDCLFYSKSKKENNMKEEVK